MPLTSLVALLLFWQGPANTLDVSVVDSSNRPVPGVRVELKTAGQVVASKQTAENGHALFNEVKPARYEVDASKDGFDPVQKADLELPASVELMLMPAALGKETIEVRGTVAPLEQGASAPNEISAQTAKELPGRPPTVTEALPLLPGVVRVQEAPWRGARARGRPRHVRGRRTSKRAHGQLGRRHRPGHRTIRTDRAHRQRRDDERLSDGFPGRVRKVHGGPGFGGDAARRRQMEMGVERSVSRFHHSQLPPARAA